MTSKYLLNTLNGEVLEIKVDQINDESKQFGKNLCMHVAASKPIAIDKNDLDISLISKEKEVHSD